MRPQQGYEWLRWESMMGLCKGEICDQIVGGHVFKKCRSGPPEMNESNDPPNLQRRGLFYNHGDPELY